MVLLFDLDIGWIKVVVGGNLLIVLCMVVVLVVLIKYLVCFDVCVFGMVGVGYQFVFQMCVVVWVCKFDKVVGWNLYFEMLLWLVDMVVEFGLFFEVVDLL